MIFFHALTSCTANLWPTLKLFAIATFSQLLNWLQVCILKNKTTQCTPHPISGSWNSFGNEHWIILFFYIMMLIGILIFHPPCQYRKKQVANLLCCTWDLFIFCILSLHPPSSSSWRCIYSYLFMPNLTSRTWCNVTYVSLKMSKLCYSFTLFCSYHLIKKCLIEISL